MGELTAQEIREWRAQVASFSTRLSTVEATIPAALQRIDAKVDERHQDNKAFQTMVLAKLEALSEKFNGLTIRMVMIAASAGIPSGAVASAVSHFWK